MGDIINKEYSTSQVAKIIGIHPNTVRLYEDEGFIPKPVRRKNGYRIFTRLHLLHLSLVRRAFEIPVLQGGLRRQIINIVRVAASQEYDKAVSLTKEYINNVDREIERANESINVTRELLQQDKNEAYTSSKLLKRHEVSEMLGITMDTLRNWEMNGLIHIKRKENGYRVYDEEDIVYLKIIRTLRCANYSLSAILRMMNSIRQDEGVDVAVVLNTPDEDEDIISVCDALIESLERAKENANEILNILAEIKSII